MTTPRIRRLEMADTRALCDMVRALAAYHGDEAEIDGADIMRLCFGATPWLYVLVADARGTLCGYAAVSRRAKLHRAQQGLNLHHLYVSPGHRGMGVGRDLVAAARMMASQMNCTYLDVAADRDNVSAQGFYKGQGFSPIERPGLPFVLKID